MGTEITLSIGGMDVAWSKNHRGIDYGSIFQESDRGRVQSDQTDYEFYEAKDDSELALVEASFVRRLSDIVPRLELLGHTLLSIEEEYARAVQYWTENQSEVESDREALIFRDFIALATKYPVSCLDDTLDLDLDDEKCKGRFASLALIDHVPNSGLWEASFYSERSYFANIINFLHPFSILRLLAENVENLELYVTWQYGPLVEAGWAELDEFTGDARRRERFLIATEGSSDVHILKHAFDLLHPGISDFFRFVDVSDGHPFSGTGQLRKFAEGLAKIDVQNQTVFVFDNDAEGVEACQRVAAMKLPSNMRSMVLPDHETLRSFPILGPNGLQAADINGHAAAIECYLDLTNPGRPPAQATWSNFKRELGRWQGALDFKESYLSRFLRLTPDLLLGSGYDTQRIEAVLDAIIMQCRNIAGSNRLASEI